MVELILLCPQERVEPVADALQALDAHSVSVEDADAFTDAEQAVREASADIPADVSARIETAVTLSDEDRESIMRIIRKTLAGFQSPRKPEAGAGEVNDA